MTIEQPHPSSDSAEDAHASAWKHFNFDIDTEIDPELQAFGQTTWEEGTSHHRPRGKPR